MRPSAARPSSAPRSTTTELGKSAELYYLELPYSTEELRQATHELMRRNGQASCYIRPLAFRGYGEMGLYANSAPVDVIIATWPWGATSATRAPGRASAPRSRAGAGSARPVRSRTPRPPAATSTRSSPRPSRRSGYDEAILLDERGFVCEGSGENIFVIREGRS